MNKNDLRYYILTVHTSSEPLCGGALASMINCYMIILSWLQGLLRERGPVNLAE